MSKKLEKRQTQISIDHVGMTFKDNAGNDVKALQDINLDIKKGEFISLLGPSGCGKTTLLRIIADLIQPTQGSVHIGGMQQRVGIARALGIEPELLLMDEPFSALDEFTKEKLHVDLLKIWSKTNKTIIFVTHNIQEAVFLSDRICVLSPHPGRLSAVVDVDLPRPRTLDMRDTMHFAELVSKVRNSFEGGSL